MEVAMSLGSVTVGTVLFFLAVHFLPVFPKTEEELPEAIPLRTDVHSMELP
jgi:hypothetical protein